MREIKFRGKRLDNGEWLYGYMIGNDVIVGEIVEFCDEYFNTEFWWRVDPETVGQYTGLKDKNGKEIYEGDIIEFDKWMPNETFVRVIRGEVYWSNKGYWAVRNKDGKFLELLGRTENPEQIGNIYVSPELLKGEETA